MVLVAHYAIAHSPETCVNARVGCWVHSGVHALLEQSARGHVPLVLVLEVRVVSAQLRYLQLQFIDAQPLLVQQSLLCLYNFVKLL